MLSYHHPSSGMILNNKLSLIDTRSPRPRSDPRPMSRWSTVKNQIIQSLRFYPDSSLPLQLCFTIWKQNQSWWWWRLIIQLYSPHLSQQQHTQILMSCCHQDIELQVVREADTFFSVECNVSRHRHLLFYFSDYSAPIFFNLHKTMSHETL